MRKTLFASAALLGIGMAAPAFAQGMDPDQYLQQAQQEVQQRHMLRALVAINSAENELLRDSAAEEAHPTRDLPGDPPVIRQMGRAREAIQQRHWQQAQDYITEAMSHPSTSAAPGSAAAGSAGSTGAVAAQPQ